MCDSTRVVSGVKFEATPPGDIFIPREALDKPQERYPLEVMLCEDCGSIQLLNVVDPQILYGTYLYETSSSLGLPEHFRRYAREVVDLTGVPAGSLVVDIGSNDGTLLRCFQEMGMRALGVDPSPMAVATARSRGVETIQAFFNRDMAADLRERHGSIAIVTANNVIANVDALGDFVDGIRDLIDPDGYFVMETGCGKSLFDNKLIDVVYHEHLSYFTVKPLEAFFRRHGMKMIDACHIPTKGGSIRCVVQSERSSRVPERTVAAMIALEEEGGAGTLAPCREMTAFIRERKAGLLSLLDRLKAEGKTVAGYGASVGVTTLLYLMDLDRRLDYLLDDNPVRFGLFSPGHHVPVFDSREVAWRKPDYILILAWRYNDPIMKRHGAYTGRGGRFITFFPELRII